MPTYVYEHLEDAEDLCMPTVEVKQAMSEEPLTKCPICDLPVRRIVASVAGHVNKEGGSYLAERGFSKWVKRDNGVYEKEE